MLLSNLSKIVKIIKIYNFKKNKSFFSITSNSKFTNNKTIFIYDKNSKSKVSYIKEAVNNNTPALITNQYFKQIKIPQFVVSDVNVETEALLKKIYKNLPDQSIAITGTNGKTSVVWYISKILTLLNYSNSSLGTLGHYRNGKKLNEVELTTPFYEDIYKYGNSNIKNKNIFIFEASSHALEQNRLRSYPVNIAAITNISKDHLDFHKNFSNYKKAKIKLFTKHLSMNGLAIINSRIKNSLNIGKKLINKNCKVIYFGKNYIFFKKFKKGFQLNINKKKFILKRLKLNTDIELENLECAIACCIALKINEKLIINVLPSITNAPGRLQKLNYIKKKSKIIIDYAHTPEALKRILKSFEINKIKPSIVFGCGGNRDVTKRKEMGIIANKYAKKVYITDDNPRNENPSKIRKNILIHCPSGIEVPNRKMAIKKAIKDIISNEILIIAGKGHEKFQIKKNKKEKFDDLKIAKEIILNDK